MPHNKSEQKAKIFRGIKNYLHIIILFSILAVGLVLVYSQYSTLSKLRADITAEQLDLDSAYAYLNVLIGYKAREAEYSSRLNYAERKIPDNLSEFEVLYYLHKLIKECDLIATDAIRFERFITSGEQEFIDTIGGYSTQMTIALDSGDDERLEQLASEVEDINPPPAFKKTYDEFIQGVRLYEQAIYEDDFYEYQRKMEKGSQHIYNASKEMMAVGSGAFLPVTLNVQGGYRDLVFFLRQLRERDMLFRVDAIDISRVQVGNTYKVNARIGAVTFYVEK